MKVLVLKTSSLSDIIHTFPAISDAKAALGDVTFDWIVEEGFADVPNWHPEVDSVIPVAIRRWRKHIPQYWRGTEWKAFKAELQRTHYDAVIDCQGLIKSAWLLSFAHGPSYGYDVSSVRESMATMFYNHRFNVPTKLHAVERTRSLFAQALGYPLPDTKPDFSIDRAAFQSKTRLPTMVFVHGTSQAKKCYPVECWIELANRAVAMGYTVKLPWHSQEERERAEQIAAVSENIKVLPKLNLTGVIGVVAEAELVVSVDTGVGHMASSMGVPTIALYGETSSSLVGSEGDNVVNLDAREIANNSLGDNTSWMDCLTPDIIWQEVTSLIDRAGLRKP